MCCVTNSSVFSNNAPKSESLTFMGVWTVNLNLFPMPSGKLPYLKIFHELLIVTGTTQASGAFLHNIFNPLDANGFGCPFLVRVPSGKITVDRLLFWIYSPIFFSSGNACRGSFLSISTEPPCCRLYDTLGMPLPNSILLTNFGWNSRKSQAKPMMSKMPWWFATKITGLS